MRLKSYFANTVEAAMSLARQELGPDALLMKSSPALPEARYLGRYEVVFALTEAVPEATPATAPAPALDRLTQDVADLRRQLERTVKTMARASHAAPPAGGQDPRANEVTERLRAAEVSEASIARIARRMGEARWLRPAGGSISPDLEEALAAEIPTAARLGREESKRRVVALVGPPGAGKTTTLVKLAVLYGLKSRRPAQILSADLYRIAAADQLRSYASIVGVGFQTAETSLILKQQLEEHRNKDLILIDTPGYGARDMDAALDLAALLASHGEIDTHLVLTATTKMTDLLAAADRFSIFRPSKLMLTRSDETGTLGPVVDLCHHTGLPVSFLGTGQQIPEDLEEADARKIAARILGERSEPGEERSTWAAA